jgi:hypothetical protein
VPCSPQAEEIPSYIYELLKFRDVQKEFPYHDKDPDTSEYGEFSYWDVEQVEEERFF